MEGTQEYMLSCGNRKILAHLPIERTRLVPKPPPPAVPLPDTEAALREAEMRLGRDCTITYHPNLEERLYFTRVHVTTQ